MIWNNVTGKSASVVTQIPASWVFFISNNLPRNLTQDIRSQLCASVSHLITHLRFLLSSRWRTQTHEAPNLIFKRKFKFERETFLWILHDVLITWYREDILVRKPNWVKSRGNNCVSMDVGVCNTATIVNIHLNSLKYKEIVKDYSKVMCFDVLLEIGCNFFHQYFRYCFIDLVCYDILGDALCCCRITPSALLVLTVMKSAKTFSVEFGLK